jgi:hypothetical protein
MKIDARELLEVLRLTPPSQNVMLVGKHGIGKSEIITRFFREERGMEVVAFFLGQMSDPGDLIGLLHKDEATGRSIFLPPFWWPVDGEPIVLFLDELNRARPEILQSVHELALNKTLAGKRLPEGSVVVAAVNEGDEYQLTDLDPALVSRFNLYEFAPTAEDWLLWADANGVDPRILSFIQRHPQHLDGGPTEAGEALMTARGGLVKTPDRRAWVRASDFVRAHERLDDTHVKILAGIVGTAAALTLRKSLSRGLAVSPEELLLHFGRYKKKLEKISLQDLVLLNEQIVFWLNGGHYAAEDEPAVRKNLLAYVRFLDEGGRREAIAHFASLLDSPKFEKTMGFVAGTAEIVEILTGYLESIRLD